MYLIKLVTVSKAIFLLIAGLIISPAAQAQLQPPELSSLRIEQIFDDGYVTINGIGFKVPFKEAPTAKRGETVATIRSRAQFYSPNRIQGVMHQNTEIELGKTSIKLKGKLGNQGKAGILINGKGTVCWGTVERCASSKSTFFVIEQSNNDLFTVATLAGDVSLYEPTLVDPNYSILNRYPLLSPSVGLTGSGFANAFPKSGGLLLGGVNAFVPLSQNRAASILYSYSTLGSNANGYSALSTEIGYRWLTPANQSTTSVYVGYGGYDNPSCFSNLVNLGAGWERYRWRVGASTGLKVGGCSAGFNFASLNLSAPLLTINHSRSAHLSFTPYLLWGENILFPSNLYTSSTSASPGARLSLAAPVSENLSLNAFASVDTVYGVTIGGAVKLRFAFDSAIVKDPNLTTPLSTQPPSATPATLATANGTDAIVPETYKATFNAKGERIGGLEQISPSEYTRYIVDYLEGIPPLAESNRVAKVAARIGALTNKVSGILGTDYLEIASIPVSETVQQPFDTTHFPTATYSCQVSEAGKLYAVERLLKENKIDAANQVAAASTVYYGPGDKVSNGWPVTSSASKAYRFANGSACREANAIIERDANYNGPPNPVQTIILP